ncbi:bifunctional salicylyl-CoA 5-hydroxylase/oxidoreductase [Candidatus Foliamicus sp.]
MRILIAGGGPTGLYLAISMLRRSPKHRVTVLERNRADDTYGWGVVFSDATLENLTENDPKTAREIRGRFTHWDDIEVHFRGRKLVSGGHGFCGIGRKRLLRILQRRAAELGAELRFETEAEPDLNRYRDYDLVVATDGINSRFRQAYAAHFDVEIQKRTNCFQWLGTRRHFEAFNFIFKELAEGWIWAHAYRFENGLSTFIPECGPDTWQRLGFAEMGQEQSCRILEKIFARHLDGHRLMSNAAHIKGHAWLNFSRVHCEKWRYRNLILAGDAAHTAHFSIGSGTKLGLEDAIELADALNSGGATDQALQEYEESRRLEVIKLQSAARNSTEWFEQVPRYTRFAPQQFNYSLLTRSQRVSHENLRLRDPAWLKRMERWYSHRATGSARAVAPMFVPFAIKGLELPNRVVVAPMDMYSAVDGTVGDFHLVHLGSRAQGGAGLVFTEMSCVSPEGRITPGCAGVYRREHAQAYRRIVDFVHSHSQARMALQIGHSGPKGSTKLMWEGMDEPLDSGNWEIIGPSERRYRRGGQLARPMTRADMDLVIEQFREATRLGLEANFDWLELHCAHGYLLSAFITPLSNRRRDAYGGTLRNRLRYPLEVLEAVREVWPQEKPLSVRISATDWVASGVTAEEAVKIARAMTEAGADIIHVSAGQTSTRARPVYGRMFQTPFSDRIRNEAGVPTIAVGNIYETDHVNSILAAGRADLCALARPHLSDPYWTLRAATTLGHSRQDWPIQYLSGKEQAERLALRAAALQEANI